MKKRKILVTNGLTYANSSIHLGHMVGYVQADIWVRFQKMLGSECYYVCGSDCHGTPIMIRAEQESISPETLVKKIQQEQEADCQSFLIGLDKFYTTHSEENRELTMKFYQRLMESEDILTKTIEQAFDPVKQIFLPDRYVKGECPNCGAKDQYGDSCEVCSSTYSPTDLKNPISILSGQPPIRKTSEHYFFRLSRFADALKQWSRENHLPAEAINKLDEWFKQGLQDWDISRDAPYFGFEIPNAPGKYFYVWLDAPIGYFAAFKNLCADHPSINFEDYIQANTDTELYHFIGKDIMYFHALFWPAILMSAHLRTPTKISIQGFLTVNGQKMSKSRGTAIKARTYLNHLHPEYFRYYLASKLTTRIEDIDLNLDDFRLKVNADLVGKVVNIASRCAGFINKSFDHTLSCMPQDLPLVQTFQQAQKTIADDYENREFAQVVRHIMHLADLANQYIDEQKPWVTAKDPARQSETQVICTVGLNCFRWLMTYLKPILPELASKAESFLNIERLTWDSIHSVLENHTILPFTPLMQRIDIKQVEAIIEDSKP